MFPGTAWQVKGIAHAKSEEGEMTARVYVDESDPLMIAWGRGRNCWWSSHRGKRMKWSRQERPAPERSMDYLPSNAREVRTQMPNLSKLINEGAKLPEVSSSVDGFFLKIGIKFMNWERREEYWSVISREDKAWKGVEDRVNRPGERGLSTDSSWWRVRLILSFSSHVHLQVWRQGKSGQLVVREWKASSLLTP